MNWLKSWWNQKHGIKRSSREGDRLTDGEQRLIHETHNCPDCNGRLVEGPHGGAGEMAAANYCCEQCHSEFSLTILGCGVIGMRISDRGPRALRE